MVEEEYILELKTKDLDGQEQEELLERIEDEIDVEFSENGGREELSDPGTIIAFYTATVGSLGLFLQLYDWVQEEDEPVEVSVRDYGDGDLYIIDADEANQVGATILEQENETVVTELTYDEAKELERMREEDN